MEPIEILFKEYDTLRAEILAAINNMYQVIGFGVALATALLSWSASKGLHVGFWIMLVVLPLIIWLFWLALHVQISRATERIREIESHVNAIAGEELLRWETRESPSKLWLVTLIARLWKST